MHGDIFWNAGISPEWLDDIKERNAKMRECAIKIGIPNAETMPLEELRDLLERIEKPHMATERLREWANEE